MATLEEEIARRQANQGQRGTGRGVVDTMQSTNPLLFPLRTVASVGDVVRRGAAGALGGELENPEALTEAYDQQVQDFLGGARSGILDLIGATPQEAGAGTQQPAGGAGAGAGAGGGTDTDTGAGAGTQDFDAQVAAAQEEANQQALQEFADRPAEVDTRPGGGTVNTVPSEFFTGGVNTANRRQDAGGFGALPQPLDTGGGNAVFLQDPASPMNPESRNFDPVAYRAALAQDRVDAQRDQAQIQADARLQEADLAGRFGVLQTRDQLMAEQSAAQQARQQETLMAQLQARLDAQSPHADVARVNALNRWRRIQLEDQLLEEGDISPEQLVAPQQQGAQEETEVYTSPGGVPFAESRGGPPRGYPPELVEELTRLNRLAQGVQ